MKRATRTVDFKEFATRFPDMTLGDLGDLCFMLGVELKFSLRKRDEFLDDAWQRKAAREKGVDDGKN